MATLLVIDNYDSFTYNLVQYFYQLGQQVEVVRNDKISNDFDLEITHQDIAQDLNSSRVVITRILKKLHDDGKIYSTRNRVKVLELLS